MGCRGPQFRRDAHSHKRRPGASIGSGSIVLSTAECGTTLDFPSGDDGSCRTLAYEHRTGPSSQVRGSRVLCKPFSFSTCSTCASNTTWHRRSHDSPTLGTYPSTRCRWEHRAWACTRQPRASMPPTTAASRGTALFTRASVEDSAHKPASFNSFTHI